MAARVGGHKQLSQIQVNQLALEFLGQLQRRQGSTLSEVGKKQQGHNAKQQKENRLAAEINKFHDK